MVLNKIKYKSFPMLHYTNYYFTAQILTETHFTMLLLTPVPVSPDTW